MAGAADTTVVVVNPGWGDAVQANKAGLLEIADVFVINKADRPGADETRRDLERMLDLTAADGWRPPVVATTAATGEGVDELWAAIGDHRAPPRVAPASWSRARGPRGAGRAACASSPRSLQRAGPRPPAAPALERACRAEVAGPPRRPVVGRPSELARRHRPPR